MKRTTKILGSTTGLLAAAAFSGMITGAAAASVPGKTTIAKASANASAGVKARNMDDQSGSDKHDCKGQNSCKGKGGCKSGDNGCKGQNSCKGKGGCKTNGGL
jgi:hypothetical protein